MGVVLQTAPMLTVVWYRGRVSVPPATATVTCQKTAQLDPAHERRGLT
jgi:hypothetical protein